MKRSLRALAAVASLLMIAAGLSGCMNYSLGSMLPGDIKTVYVPTFVNNTTEPMIEVDATKAAIQEIQKDGSLKVAGSAEEADALLTVTMIDFTLNPVVFDRNRATTTEEYRMLLTVSVVMTRRTTDQVVAESPRIQGEYVFTVSGDLTSSKEAALPFAAADLAHNIVESIVETWQ
jgi:hypothetical protein